MNDKKTVSFGMALAIIFLPILVILLGGLVLREGFLVPLMRATITASLLSIMAGFTWKEVEACIVNGVHRIIIVTCILFLVGTLIGVWIQAGVIPLFLYWGLKLLSPSMFLVSTVLICAVFSLMTGTSFGTIGTAGLALLGVGEALGFPTGLTAGAIVSGAYFGDKMSPVSDSTNITASVCEVPLFDHILSMLWTTVPAFVAAGIVYTVLGFSFAQEQTASLESLNAILSGLEGHFSLDFVAFIPPILMIALAYKRFPVLPVMVACLLSAVAIAVYEGVAFNDLAKMMTSGYVSKTGIKQLDPLLSRGGLLSIMPTVLLLCSGMAFGGILERSRVLEVLLDAVLKGARSAVRLVASVLAAAYIINLGTGSQMLAVIVPGRAFLDSFKKADISPLVLSRTCEDAGTIGCPLVPWSVHAFYIAGVLGVSAFDFAPYAFLNWFVPIFSILCALTGFGIWRLNGTPVHGSRKA